MKLPSFVPVVVTLWSLLAPATATTPTSSSTSSSHLDLEGHLTELPDSGTEWQTLEDGVQFQPARQDIRFLKRSGSGSTSGYENIFVDGSGTYYNDYAQAWRLLGFYIDCNAPQINGNECYDEGGGGGHEREGQQGACQRYLLWAAVSHES
jgi:hypothetical protein